MTFLFLLKMNEAYGSYSKNSKAGLTNSAKFLAESIMDAFPEITCIVQTCVDGNEIDKYITLHKPVLCFVEAIWVEPAKFKELVKLHTKVRFIVRVHSNTPFLAGEGIAIEWLKQYSNTPNVIVSFNNEATNHEYRKILNPIYLPNCYDINLVFKLAGSKLLNSGRWFRSRLSTQSNVVNIGCFGAIRPLKNQLIQALAAMDFGDQFTKTVRFHINSERVEMAGESILKNISALFENTKHELVRYEWMDRPEFLGVISQMDIGMQVSFSESFNIVAADFIAQGIPIIVSSEIAWMPAVTQATPTDSAEMVSKLADGLQRKSYYVDTSLKALRAYHNNAMEIWTAFIDGIRVEL